jgi:pimeloyl-ACP methyl ester carboxylesterase
LRRQALFLGAAAGAAGLLLWSLDSLPRSNATAGFGAGDVARFEAGACWGSGTDDDVELRCGYLVVPESRERPNGRAVEVAVTMLLPAGTPNDELPGPLVYLAGGPGYGSGLTDDWLSFWIDWYAAWEGGKSRTLILVDQRGTGQSKPLLRCDDEIAEPAMRSYFGTALPRSAAAHATWWRQYLLECRAPFDAAGIDVTAYNTAENAADLADLRHALGLAQWDVWGASYGTELALALLQVDEAGIRSLILDSVSLHQRSEVAVGSAASSFDRALKQLVRDCYQDADCKSAYPVILSSFSRGLGWLNAKPATLALASWPDMPYVLDGRRAADLLFNAMYYPDMIPLLPAMVTDFGLGADDQLAAFANFMLEMDAFSPASELMITSVSCRSAPIDEAFERLRDEEGRHPGYVALWAADWYDIVCADWGSKPATPAERGPVYSDVPALVLAGRYDPITPPDWGRIVAGWLPNSTMLEFPNLTHGIFSVDPCADRIATRFLDRPDEDPVDGCFGELQPIRFELP